MSGPPLLLYDGTCGLCHTTVQFVLRHERAPALHFAALESPAGEAARARYGVPDALDSVIFIHGDRVTWRSTAALDVAGYLRAPWRWARLLRLVPAWLRDPVYRLIARFRFTVFGRRSSCVVPAAGQAGRFHHAVLPDA